MKNMGGINEVVVFVITMVAGLDLEYYPSSLDEKEVSVKYYEDSTVFEINKSLIPATIACTKSMQPMIGCSNKAYLEKLAQESIVNVGDIVAYEKEGKFIMHQIIKDDGNCYYLKGYNSMFADQTCVKREDMVYRAVVILPT